MQTELQYLKDRIDEIKAEANCKDCFGRGVSGWDTKTGKKIICKCILKKIDKMRKEYHEQNQSQEDIADPCSKGEVGIG
jgi:hypothetical protein